MNDDQPIKAIYGSDLPTLKEVHLFEIRIKNGLELDCILTFDLASLPKILPIKWQERKVNTIQLNLNLVTAEIVYFHSTGSDVIGDIEIEPDGDLKIITFKVADRSVFQIKARWILISSIFGYTKQHTIGPSHLL